MKKGISNSLLKREVKEAFKEEETYEQDTFEKEEDKID